MLKMPVAKHFHQIQVIRVPFLHNLQYQKLIILDQKSTLQDISVMKMKYQVSI